jgi:hydroxyacylglutathione hydrolase
MQITKHIHALKIPFKIPIAPDRLIDRIAYVFPVFGETVTLIDSGVSGADLPIFAYIRQNGRNPEELSMLILSHSHPDHIGAAKAIREATGCTVAAHSGEKRWIEDTEGQFKARPVPGFHTLVGGPVAVDRLLADGETVNFGKDLKATVIHTPGHSQGSISLLFESEKALFSGDAVPLPNDLPIYENIVDSVKSMRKLKACKTVETLFSSWEAPVRGRENIERRIDAGLLYLRRIHETVLKAKHDGKEDLTALCRQVVAELGLPPFAAMPLVARAFASSLDAEKNRWLFEDAP